MQLTLDWPVKIMERILSPDEIDQRRRGPDSEYKDPTSESRKSMMMRA